MKKTLAFLLILSSIIGFSQTKPTDPGFKSLITPRAVTFWWDAANSDPWMQSSYLGTAPNTWVKLWTATKTQVKLDSLANAKQDTLMLTTTGTGAATLIGSTLNIPISSGIVPDSLKEDKANKENTTVDNNTTKYPTVNLLKTYTDTKTPLDKFVNKTPYSYYRPIKFIDNFSANTKNSNVIFLGDSNYDSAERLMTPFLNTMLTYKKSSGVGYFSFASGTTAIGMFNLGYSGTWVSTNIMGSGCGLEGRQAYSNTSGSEITINTNSAINYDLSKFNKIRVYYKITGNAGTIGYSINSGSYSNVVLSTTVVNNLGYFDIILPSVATTWTVKVKLVSGECTLLGGVISNTTQKGIIVHKAGHAGANSENFSTLSNTSAWKSLVQDINPDIVFIGLTTNDFSNGVALETTRVNILNLISNIKLASPSASIYVISPPRLDESLIPVTSITAAQNNTMLATLCESEKVGFISIFNIWDKYPTSYTNTLFADGIHYNSDGAIINSIIISSYIVPDPYYNNTNNLQRVTDNGNTTTNNILVRDVVASRGTTGVVFLNDAQDRYVYYDNGYYMPSNELYVNANNLVYNTGNSNKNSVDWKTNNLKVGDDQSTNNPILFLYGGTGSAASSRTASFQVDATNRNLNIGSWNKINLYSNVPNQTEPTAGNLGITINTDASVMLPSLVSANIRLLSALPDGTITTTDLSTGTLSGTNVTWDYSVKKNYNITLTGNTVITITNVSDGDSGTLYVTNAATPYTITFAGYVNSIDPYIRLGSNMVITSGGSKSDDYTFKYNGSKMNWNGTLDRH